MESVSFSKIVSCSCNIDIHKKIVVARINGEGLRKETREFNIFTSSFTELKDWLLANGITHVAIENSINCDI